MEKYNVLLTIDIGNTDITLGIYNNDVLIETFRLVSDKDLSEKEYGDLLKNSCKEYIINHCVIGSVVKELGLLIKKAVDNIFEIDSFLVNATNFSGLKINLKNPQSVGIDRIANAYGAKTKYVLPLIVVDIGTAMTFDIVSKNGEFIGGVIMPGLNLQLKSLNLHTSLLPKIEVGVSEKAIGDSTEQAILSGIMRGSACAIEGLINQCELELGEKATVIATGGCSQLVAEYMNRKFDYIDSNLTLEGLKLIYEHNV